MANYKGRNNIASTGGCLLLFAVVVSSLMVAPSIALPVRITRQTPGSASDSEISSIQENLKNSINALTLITKSYPMHNACWLWENVTSTVLLHQLENTTNSSSNTTSHVEFRHTTCLKISEEMMVVDLIKDDGSCSEETLDYVCYRQLQMMESYTLFGDINVDTADFLGWVLANFDESLSTRLRDLYE